MARSWVRRLAVALVAAGIGATGSSLTVATPAGATATGSPGRPVAHRQSRRCPLPVFGPGRSYRPAIHPRNFSPDVTNPWFPLVVGRTMVYTGVKDGEKALDIVVVTKHVRVVDGVRTRVVEDRLYLAGVLEERTRDYYAQDRCGNVWYFGEDTATLDAKGRVTSREGSFRAGRAGAHPGVFMQARPTIGRWFRQEWYAGHAEDRYRALSRTARVSVRFGTFRHALRTEERTDLERGVVDQKYYVRGVGEVFEGAVKGGNERLELVEVIS